MFFNGNSSSNGIKGVIRHYNYKSDNKLGQGIVAIRRSNCSFHACTTQLFLIWDSTMKYACNQPRYWRFYECKYCLTLGSHNNWVNADF